MTTPTPNDFRELCAELLEKYDLEWRARERIKTALSQPEPEGVTDEELVELDDSSREAVHAAVAEALGDVYDCLRVWDAWSYGTMGPDDFSLVAEDDDRVAEIADAAINALARLAIQPVPVAERLPGPEDCDAEGRCWLCGKVEGDWRLLNPARSGVPQLKYCFSHWLPHHALPVPQQEPQP
jgi:hypothetical protein